MCFWSIASPPTDVLHNTCARFVINLCAGEGVPNLISRASPWFCGSLRVVSMVAGEGEREGGERLLAVKTSTYVVGDFFSHILVYLYTLLFHLSCMFLYSTRTQPVLVVLRKIYGIPPPFAKAACTRVCSRIHAPRRPHAIAPEVWRVHPQDFL